MACILLWNYAARVHDWQAYRKMNVTTTERISRILELREVLPSFKTGFNLVSAAVVVCAIVDILSRIAQYIFSTSETQPTLTGWTAGSHWLQTWKALCTYRSNYQPIFYHSSCQKSTDTDQYSRMYEIKMVRLYRHTTITVKSWQAHIYRLTY